MALEIREIPLGAHMTKWHFQQPGIPAMHEMRAPDLGDPHDHPFGMHSFVLFGGYREEIFRPDGTSFFVDHHKGESFWIPAKRVHRIVELFEGVCWTITLPGEFVQEWGSWQFREDGAYRRTFPHDEWVKQDQPDIHVPSAPESHMTGWQPIETAPKDGRHVILYCDYYGIGRCAWESWRGVWRSDDPNHGIGFPQPTHWMPLPDYPAGTVRAENARRAAIAATTEGQNNG